MNAPTDLNALKTRQQTAWASGDYAVIGTTLQIVGEQLAEACDLRWDERVLDVAAGNGNASLAAARRGCQVTASDYVSALLDRAAVRADAEGLPIEIREADAEALPFPDAGYDAVLSTFGVMFCPNADRAATELVRVCRPGGRIGLANWTPSGFVGQMFKIVGKFAPPPAGVASPLLWGVEARLAELFDREIASLRIASRSFVFRYRSAEHWLDTFRTYYGPMVKAFGSLDDTGRAALEAELLTLARQSNTSKSDALRVPSEYLEVVATKAG